MRSRNRHQDQSFENSELQDVRCQWSQTVDGRRSRGRGRDRKGVRSQERRV